MSKKLSKYIASFEYFEKSLIVLSPISGSISIASFATVVGAAAEIAGASFCFAFSVLTRIVKKLSKITQNNKTKHMPARSKLNSKESTISEGFNR